MRTERVCAKCGKTFLPKRPNQKYCVRACWTAAVNERLPVGRLRKEEWRAVRRRRGRKNGNGEAPRNGLCEPPEASLPIVTIARRTGRANPFRKRDVSLEDAIENGHVCAEIMEKLGFFGPPPLGLPPGEGLGTGGQGLENAPSSAPSSYSLAPSSFFKRLLR